MRYFCEDITASKTALLIGINRHTINRYYNLFLLKIAASAQIEGQNCIPVIPPRSNRKTPRDYDEHLYKERHLVE